LSAEVTMAIDSVPAHRVSPALARLDEQGRLGLHVVDGEDRIEFRPVEVVRARADGVWITGLPQRARIITISQGALSAGQRVEVRETPPEYLEAAPEDSPVPDAQPETPAEAAEPPEDEVGDMIVPAAPAEED